MTQPTVGRRTLRLHQHTAESTTPSGFLFGRWPAQPGLFRGRAIGMGGARPRLRVESGRATACGRYSVRFPMLWLSRRREWCVVVVGRGVVSDRCGWATLEVGSPTRFRSDRRWGRFKMGVAVSQTFQRFAHAAHSKTAEGSEFAWSTIVVG